MKTLVPCGSLVMLLGLLYLPVLWDLGAVWWTDPNYSHGFLIPFMTGYLIWSRQQTLGAMAVQPSAWGILLLLVSLLLLLMGHAVASAALGRGGLFVQGISLILTLAGLVLFLMGKEWLKVLAFPLAYLLCMIPLPKKIFAMVTLPLQFYASKVATAALQFCGILALREGNLIHLPAVTLGVTEACSGIRSLFTLLAGAIVLSYLTQKRWWQRLILIVSAVPVAIVANALRVTGTGLLAHVFGPAMAENFFHEFSGWVILIIAALLLCTEAMFLAKLPGDESWEPVA